MKNIVEAARVAMPVEKRDHIQGPVNAPLTLLEYGDFECPACGIAYTDVKKVQQNLGPRLRLVFRHFPLNHVHPHAERAAWVSEAAATRGAFWEMHDLMFENQHALEDEGLMEYAAALNLDTASILRELGHGAHVKRVREDFISGVRRGVNHTPTFFINDIRYHGSFDPRSLIAALEQASHTE